MKRIIFYSITYIILINGLCWPTIINIPVDYATIQLGINAAIDDDTVLVQPGIYVENINFINKYITVASLFLTTSDPSYIDSTIIDGNSSGSVVLFESGETSAAKITGFTLQNGLAQFGGGISCALGSNPVIVMNKIINNTAEQSGGGISCWSNANPSIANNVISGNSALAFGGGIMCSINSDAVFTNNTITENEAAQGGGGISSWSSNPTLTNCIFWGDEAGGFSNEISGTMVITFSDIQGGWQGEGNIDDNPLFCDPDINDYFLSDNSPCAGTGQNGDDIGAFGIGCEATDILEDNLSLPNELSLNQSYPNPFNAQTTIEYSLSALSNVSIEIYDLLGHEVATLVDEERQTGKHQVIWNSNGYSSGVYFYRLQAGELVETKRMLLLK